jgi:hypothetical protein
MFNAPRVPEFEPFAYKALLGIPLELLPLYTPLALMHDEMSGAPANSCIPVCYQIAGALGHLGFDAEVMAAYATVSRRQDGQVTKVVYVGVSDRPPTVRSDGMTDGHVVLWVGSFRRMVDPTIVQAPLLLAAARHDPGFTIPAVLPVASRERLLAAGSLGTLREPFFIEWKLRPEWTGALAAALGGDIGAALPYGSLRLAHTAVDILRFLGTARPDMGRLSQLYPELEGLLTGHSELPRLPAEPPAAFVRIRQAAGKASDIPDDPSL